jgi:hypothetical protein
MFDQGNPIQVLDDCVRSTAKCCSVGCVSDRLTFGLAGRGNLLS